MGIKEDLYEQYDDILFKAVMLQVANEEGRRLISENERLKADPSFAVPTEVYKHGLGTIRRAFRKGTREAKTKKMGKLIYRVAGVILVLFLLTCVAFAAFPDLRVKFLNVFMHEYETHTEFMYQTEGSNEEEYSIRVEWMPQGFALEERGGTSIEKWEKWSDKDGRAAILSKSEPVTESFDTEDAEVSSVSIHEYQGTLIVKNDMIQIVWFNSDTNVVYTITSAKLTKTEAMKIAQNFW